MMRLGTQTGSMTNHLMSRSSFPEPVVGMGATILGWTDRHPATIVEVIKTKAGKLKAVVIQEDSYEAVSGKVYEDNVEYKYSANPEAPKQVYTLRKDGSLVKAGSKHGQILIGQREKYYDPHF